ncbi:MAG TPA: CopG family transcriptional regulator [Anaerolineae bacterium]|nr:CopG family transcriptional regulator [Anaerolineae bacterium]
MVNITISIEDELAKSLQTLAERSKLTEAEIIENALKRYVTSSEVDPLIGLFDLGDPYLAERAEDILRTSIKPHSGWTNKE